MRQSEGSKMIYTRKEANVEKAMVLKRPKYVSAKKAPSKVAKLVLPLKMLMMVVAVMFWRLKTVVRYTNRLDNVPIAPSFSNVSLPSIQFQAPLMFERRRRRERERERTALHLLNYL